MFLSEYETEYEVRINNKKCEWELVKWEGDYKVISHLPYGKDGLNFKECKKIMSKLLREILSIDPTERVY